MKSCFTNHLTIAIGAISLISAKAANEGYFRFLGSAPSSEVWENFSTGVFQGAPGTVKVAFFWGATNVTPLVESVLAFTPTNLQSDIGGGSWNYVLNDPNFTEAVNANSGQPAIVSVNPNAVNQGGYAYNGGLSFPVAGTLAESTYAIYVIGWPASYSTPQAAAAVGAALGWSNMGFYTSGPNSIRPEFTFNSAGIKSFGVNVPEPSALAMFAYGAAAYLAKRRNCY